jgi:hypothetical protein
VLDGRGGIGVLHGKEQYALSVSSRLGRHRHTCSLTNAPSIDVANRASTATIASWQQALAIAREVARAGPAARRRPRVASSPGQGYDAEVGRPYCASEAMSLVRALDDRWMLSQIFA